MWKLLDGEPISLEPDKQGPRAVKRVDLSDTNALNHFNAFVLVTCGRLFLRQWRLKSMPRITLRETITKEIDIPMDTLYR